MNNKMLFILVVAFLGSMNADLSANTRTLINEGKVNPRDADLVVRKEIVAGGTIDLLENAGQAAVRGVNDFNGNRLTNGRNFVLDSLTINYGTAAAGAGPATVLYTTPLPAALLTANLILKQNEVVIRRFSVAEINAAKNTQAYFRELGGFALLVEERTTSIELEFGAGTALNAGVGNGGFVEVIFKGFETNVKG